MNSVLNSERYYRETMESMLVEQHYLRSPALRPFAELDTHNNNLSLEEKALLAARSQLFLRAAAAAAATGGAPGATSASPYGPLPGLYTAAVPLWGQWAQQCQLLQQHQLQAAMAAAAAAAASSSSSHGPSPPAIARPLAQHRYSPYATPTAPGMPTRGSPPVSSPDTSLRDAPDPSPPPS